MEKLEKYYVQLQDGISEMEAVIEVLRVEISELKEQKDTMLKIVSLLKKEAKDLLF
ncbi:hypothetical protein [Bacillus sp. V3-13]|uniref:hypothetical protein n=1 Tax=Bacillus sp. V3-13 TaxID=2053728 RepID=UPI0015E08FA1|nr:hypothetical protein [Bacillus sp. V3-13]